MKNLTVDSGFGLDTMLALAKEFKDFSGDQMVTHTLPTTPFTTNGGAEVLRLDTAGAQPIFDLFKGTDAAPQVKPSDVTLSVRNSSGVNGAAAKAQGQLQASASRSAAPTPAPSPRPRPPVQFGSGAQDQAKLVAKHVKGGAETHADSSLAAGEVKLVIGKDYVSIVDDTGKTVVASTTAPGRPRPRPPHHHHRATSARRRACRPTASPAAEAGRPAGSTP